MQDHYKNHTKIDHGFKMFNYTLSWILVKNDLNKDYLIVLQETTISVFLLQNVMFKSRCYLLFLHTFLWKFTSNFFVKKTTHFLQFSVAQLDAKPRKMYCILIITARYIIIMFKCSNYEYTLWIEFWFQKWCDDLTVFSIGNNGGCLSSVSLCPSLLFLLDTEPSVS